MCQMTEVSHPGLAVWEAVTNVIAPWTVGSGCFDSRAGVMEMEQALNLFAEALLAKAVDLLTPVLVAALIAVAASAFQWIRLKVGDERWAAIVRAADDAIALAEAVGLTDELYAEGAKKKELALTVTQRELAKVGITVSLARLSEIIESRLVQTLNAHKLGQ